MLPGMVRRLVLVTLGCALAVGVRADGIVLHEYVPGLSEGELSLILAGQDGEPMGMLYDGELVGEPTAGAARGDEKVLSALAPAQGGASSEPPTYRPDRLTGSHSATGYFEVFTPSIAPFKRVDAFDRVALDPDGTPVLVASEAEPEPLPVIGTVDPAGDGRPRDRFWGSLVVDFRGGDRVAIPSVSPESRILHVRTEPLTRVRFEVDPAGNQYVVRLDETRGEVRITYLTDAPRGFFNMPVPDVRADALASRVPAMPPRVKERALAFARELGLSPSDSLSRLLSTLVEHFRSFREADELPRHGGDIYGELARGGVGVCRHRAYAFVITAQALGIPSHYVQNEAHAWVEARLGDAGFVRIDLGGSSRGVEGHGLQDRPPHRTTAPDPFPRPAIYVETYEHMRASSSSSQSPFAHADEGPRTSEGHEPPIAAPDPSAVAANPPSSPVPSDPSLVPVSLAVESREFRGFRGRAIDVRGRASDPTGSAVEGLRVEVVLEGPSPRLLGEAVTHEDGSFDATLDIPPDLPVGEYAISVRTPGDAAHAPAELR